MNVKKRIAAIEKVTGPTADNPFVINILEVYDRCNCGKLQWCERDACEAPRSWSYFNGNEKVVKREDMTTEEFIQIATESRDSHCSGIFIFNEPVAEKSHETDLCHREAIR